MKKEKKTIDGFDAFVIEEILPEGYEDITSVNNWIKIGRFLFKDYKYIGKIELHHYEDFNVEIEGGLGYVYFEKGIYVNGYVVAEAGSGIKAGSGIEAGEGIVAGLFIQCKKVLKFKLRLFAGVCWWREINENEKKITCGKLEGGEVCYGDVEELGLSEEKKDEEVIEVNGKKYKRI